LPLLKKYYRRSIACKIILSFFLLASSFCTKAQIDPNIDSIKAIIETVEAHKDTETTAGEGKKYFLEKSEFTAETDSLHLRKLPDSLVKKLQADDDFWYANAIIEKEKIPQNNPNTSYTPIGERSWFKTLIWLIIIGGFAGFIIWYLAGNNVGLFRKRQRLINNNEEEEISDDIFAINYQKEIDKAVHQDNYRLAVRLMFLQLLKELSEKNIIQYKQGLTNADYLLQLSPTTYYPGFFRITRNYEYSWYGLFDVSAEAYSIIKNDFNNFSQKFK